MRDDRLPEEEMLVIRNIKVSRILSHRGVTERRLRDSQLMLGGVQFVLHQLDCHSSTPISKQD
jgi:hypothetical protein